MAAKYDLGTPLGGERRVRRIGSPLQEMDEMPDALLPKEIDFDEIGHERDTQASPPGVTIDAIAVLLKSCSPAEDHASSRRH